MMDASLDLGLTKNPIRLRWIRTAPPTPINMTEARPMKGASNVSLSTGTDAPPTLPLITVKDSQALVEGK